MTKKMSSKKMNYLLHKELKKVKNEERKLGLIDYLRVILVRQLNLLDQNHQHCLSTMQTMHRVEGQYMVAQGREERDVARGCEATTT